MIKSTIVVLVYCFVSFAQPELDIKPNRIEFEDLFNRYDYAFLINKGDQVLSIDSIDYDNSIYLIEFENNLQLPFTIDPDDTIRMDVTLTGFYYVTSTDTMDTMFVYNNGINSPEPLEVRIRFFEDEFGEINGIVRDSSAPVSNAIVHFLYNGIYFLDTAITDNNGFYSKSLPLGTYTIGVEKEGYYVVFHDSTYDPFFAEYVQIDSGAVRSIDFNLTSIIDTNLFVSGQIIDSINGINIPRALVIIRNGTHVPIGKVSSDHMFTDTIYTFAGFIKPDGTYSVYLQVPNYYFLQAYTNNFLPGFYNDEGNASVFWQNADSILINNNVIDKNIFLLRDSSFGNGSIGGSILFSSVSGQQDYEGITILARNINNNALYSFNFGKQEGNFKVTNIPYGTYELVAQKIGLDNAISQTVSITPTNNQITGINLNFTLADVREKKLFPNSTILYQNYPNPFNPNTIISFYLPKTSNIKLTVMNILGEVVETLVNGEMRPGNHSISFNGTNFASGVYLIILENNQNVFSKKMILLK